MMARHGPMIRRTPGGRYKAVARLKIAGVWKTRTRTFDKREAAQGWLDSTRTASRRGELADSKQMTVETWFEKWVETLDYQVTVGALRPSTESWYKTALARHLIPGLGHIRLDELTADDVEKFYAGKRRSGRVDGRGGLSAKSVRWLHVTLHRALADAVIRRVLVRNPLDALVARPQSPSKHNPLDKTWTAGQMRTFLHAAAGDRLGAAYRVAGVTGMRRGEVLGLLWGDADLATGRLSVRRSWIMVGGSPQLSEPKTPGSVRMIELDQRTVTLLRAWRKRQLEDRLAWGSGWTDSGFLFTREDGTPVRPDYFSRRFRRIAEKAGLPPIPLHGLRHSAASFALANGIGMKVVSEMLGHSSVEVTLSLYQAVTPGMHREAVELYAAALDEIGP